MRKTRARTTVVLLTAALLLGWYFSPPRTVALEGEELQQAVRPGMPRGSGKCAFSPDSKRLVVTAGYPGCEVSLFDLAPRKRTILYKDLKPGCRAVAFSPDGTWIAIGCEDGKVRLWDVTAGKETAILAGNDTGLYGVSFSPDSKLVAAAEHAGQIRVWDVKIKKQKYVLSKQSKAIIALAFTPTGSGLLYVVYPGRVACWDFASDKQRTLIEDTPKVALPLILFPNQSSFLLVCGPVRVYDVKTGKQLVSIKAKSGTAKCGNVSADGKFLFIGTGDFPFMRPSPGYVEVWTADGKYLTRFKAHKTPVKSIAVSPDGKKLATGAYLGSVKLWDISSLLPKDGK
jgi:WD40 repeat protein